MDLGLTGRVALVAGGTGLIGRAVAAALVAEGATVVIGARDELRLAEVAEGLGVGTVVLDTTEPGSVDAAVLSVRESYGPVEVLVNTAAPPADTLDPDRANDPEQVLQATSDKAMGYLRMTNAVLPGMRTAGWGRVVQLGGMHSYLTASATAATRNAAVVTTATALADGLAGTGVTVNVVHPGPVVEEPSGEVATGMTGDSTPAQVAALVVFLCSEAAGAISAESVTVGHKQRGLIAW
ncbi:short-chain dehydrogenase [Marmoricola endophyticus]|uniref:Short-chain dehydrogenase n=1 Tax=Marmoricola endophyticus TaxID=2040280 RepID=A0A917BJW5_9ACTN|nr:SDR family oxidoreductase [Marmoricola endophyticus]GGF44505.1 short-chain dehydrogenase [Marmoricola endophyticus]